ncbi:MAG TPA: beta-ketoacyl-[acyl-carrier-protein] synthase II, partial [Blastocatellia bacterium]|nr:beta-ketoacyl-[acyl-carrier-protein] synthase II [Blastocatellia bacterium]
MKRRVVVTGVGLVTPIGNDVPTTWNGLMNGANGADYIKKFDTENFSVKFACEVKDFDPLSFPDKKEARRMGAFTHFALAASDEAMKHSG